MRQPRMKAGIQEQAMQISEGSAAQASLHDSDIQQCWSHLHSVLLVDTVEVLQRQLP
jgi:hypothetical protein